MNLEYALEHLSQLLHNPNATNEEIEQVFLELMGDDLISMGGDYFRQRGRGMFIFDLRGPPGWRRGDMPTLYYLTPQDYAEAGGDTEYIEDDVYQYNPQNQVPVIFLYDGRQSGKIISKDWGIRAAAP
jgi:hypothetical protein